MSTTTEAALPGKDARFRTLFQNALDAILLTEPDGTIQAANPAACKLFGMAEEELCRTGQAGLVDPTDSRHAKAIQERARRGWVRAEVRFVRKDGSTFPAEVSAGLLPGQPPQAFVMIHDLSERQHNESGSSGFLVGKQVESGRVW